MGNDSTNTIAYSSNGINWTGLGKTIFYIGNKLTSNGSGTLLAGGTKLNIDVCVGQNGSAISYSTRPSITYVSVGRLTNTIAY